ncbi:hypothetical protein [Mangrovibacterium sp.]|uniref:hypothetical protein n=1 Tax=Mangrovibacterium sp. TaxID=1961364 RepID=UPI003566E19B
MKTRNNTTGNNKQLSGVLLRAAAILVSVVLISFTVSAQNLWAELLNYHSLEKVASILVDASTEETATELPSKSATIAFNINEENELPLEVESWMSNDNYFGASNVFNQVSTDKSLEVEGWMSSDYYFGASNIFNEEAQDETLEIESWMTEAGYFTNRYVAEPEAELQVEAWMCNAQYFIN